MFHTYFRGCDAARAQPHRVRRRRGRRRAPGLVFCIAAGGTLRQRRSGRLLILRRPGRVSNGIFNLMFDIGPRLRYPASGMPVHGIR
jgi:hypothetical protein